LKDASDTVSFTTGMWHILMKCLVFICRSVVGVWNQKALRHW